MAKDFPVMLAHNYDPDRIVKWRNYFIEPKLDGLRIIILVDIRKGKITFHTRNGREITVFKHMAHEIMKMVKRFTWYENRFRAGAMLDGEMVAEDGDFNSISGSIHRLDGYIARNARYACFHAMPLECFKAGTDDLPQRVRSMMVYDVCRSKLLDLELVSHPHGERVRSDEDVRRIYKEFQLAGHEGGMLKDMDRAWVAKRTHAWMKLKGEETADCIVTGFTKGKGKYEGLLGALILDHKGKRVKCSGMTDAEREEFSKNPKGIVGKMIEVEFQGETSSGSLRHPRFKRFRGDKQ